MIYLIRGNKMKKIIIAICIVIATIVLINALVILTTKNNILKESKLNKEIDCILILGAGIRNNKPSPMLEDRLLAGIEMYNNYKFTKILVSGDHMYENYDEVNVMKQYLIDKNIESQNIFMDHAGISTYDSIYRAKKIFKAKRIVIVTQKYHLYRALYIAKQLDIEAYGIIADKRKYYGQSKREIREIAARIKDFIKCLNKPQSKYLGEVIPISGNGDRTNDKK